MQEETLSGPSGSVVFEGTWTSSRFPFCAYGKVKCLIPPQSEWASYADTPASSEGYMTFDGHYFAGGVLKMSGSVNPGPNPPLTTTFTSVCDGKTCIDTKVVSATADTIEFTYKTSSPPDYGTMTLHRVVPEETTLSVVPCPGKRYLGGLI